MPAGMDCLGLYSKLSGQAQNNGACTNPDNNCICRWAAAPVLFSMPFVGDWMRNVGHIPAKSANIRRALQEGFNVGIVLDGIAGMFQNTNTDNEKAFLSARKGVVKIALTTGTDLVPIYWFGHTALWSALVDPFHILEWISVKFNISIVPFYGRWGWPFGPARRIPILIAFGKPIQVPKTTEPTQELIDEYHSQLVNGFKEVFDTHKVSYGWQKKQLIVV